MSPTSVSVRSDGILASGEIRPEGKSKRTWMEAINKNMILVDFTEIIHNRSEWKGKNYAANPNFRDRSFVLLQPVKYIGTLCLPLYSLHRYIVSTSLLPSF